MLVFSRPNPPLLIPTLSPPPPSAVAIPTAAAAAAADHQRNGRGVFAVSSTHSNARILKTNRRTPYGRPVANYGKKEDEEQEDSKADGAEDWDEDDDLDDEHLETCQKSIRNYSLNGQNRTGNTMFQRDDHADWSSKASGSTRLSYRYDIKSDSEKEEIGFKSAREISRRSAELNTLETQGKTKFGSVISKQNQFQRLREELDFDVKWFPLIEYLSTFGLKESDFISIYERHMPCLQINVASARERLEFLVGVGVKQRDFRKILTRQPQILEYTVENNLKAHVVFLRNIGIPDSRIGQIISAAPSLFSYSIEISLKPRIQYLIEEVGIKPSDVSKVIQLSPQILVQRIDNSWTARLSFLSKELGAPRENIVKMVTRHPQLLHYSIEDGMQPRIDFLRSIGMRNSDILKILTNLSQVFSLSLEGNLKPKYLYLVNELRNEVHSLAKYPMYLSLSLDQRIRPRHRFLVSLKKAPKGPFPLSSFVPTDKCFCQQWAGTSLEKYEAFRQSLLLEEFAKKYERR